MSNTLCKQQWLCHTHPWLTGYCCFFAVDAEYYLRDLFGGNKQEGNVLPSALPAARPPRVLQEPLVSTLLTNDFSAACIPVAVLAQTVQQRARQNGGGHLDHAADMMIPSKASAVREKASRSFYTRAPWQTVSVTDQYYFDLSAYALWRTAAELLPNFADRDVFVRNVGRALYRKMVTDKWIDAPLTKQTTTNKNSIVGTVDAARQILDVFCQSGFCKSYRLGPDPPPLDPKNNKKTKEPEPVIIVDELDVSVMGSTDVM